MGTGLRSVVGGIAIVGASIALLASGSTETVKSDAGQDVSDDRLAAASVCEDFVRDRLKSPGTASFRDPFGDQISYSGDGGGPITVDASVDSENGFGANLRSTYSCTVSKAGGDRWTLDDLQLDDGGDISP